MNTTLAPSATVTSRDPKGLKFMSIIDGAYNKAGLTEDEAQRVNEASGLSELVSKFIAESRLLNEFASEEVRSKYGYLSGYKPKGITEQTNKLRMLFSGIGFADEQIAARPLPAGAEGWSAIPKWQTMAPTYGEAVAKVFALLSSTRNGKFENYREGQLGPKYLRQSAKAEQAFAQLCEQQKDHDILVVPCQFGLRHAGRSARRARVVMNSLEFGLGAFTVGIMLLTHPERLQHFDDLWIDCAGDEFSPDADGEFSHAPIFHFDFGRLRFFTCWVGDAFDGCGSASGFLPKSPLGHEAVLQLRGTACVIPR